MKKITLYALLAALATSSLPAHALDIPQPSAYDARVRYVSYNSQDVVQIETVIGIATHIVLEEGEQYLTHAFGDSKAWAFANEKNHYFIKPKDQQADTNLTIVTDRRTYYFRLRYHATRNALAMYGISFRYPDTEAKQAQAAAKKLTVEQGFTGKRAANNLLYTMSGDTDIAPVNTWDNNEFTYFKFPGNRDVPGIYMVDAEGKESIVNRHTTGDANDIVVVQKVNAKWVLRLADRALAVYNDAYDPNGVANTSGTVSPAVKRVIKGDQ